MEGRRKGWTFRKKREREGEYWKEERKESLLVKMSAEGREEGRKDRRKEKKGRKGKKT